MVYEIQSGFPVQPRKTQPRSVSGLSWCHSDQGAFYMVKVMFTLNGDSTCSLFALFWSREVTRKLLAPCGVQNCLGIMSSLSDKFCCHIVCHHNRKGRFHHFAWRPHQYAPRVESWSLCDRSVSYHCASGASVLSQCIQRGIACSILQKALVTSGVTCLSLCLSFLLFCTM